MNSGTGISAYLSAFRNAKTDPARPQPPSVASPVGPDGTTAAQQSEAMRVAENPTWAGLPGATRGDLSAAYGRGGFEGVAKAGGDAWWDLPSDLRTKILAGARGGG